MDLNNGCDRTGAVFSTFTATAITITAFAGLYILYCLALPKPLSDIPYNAISAKRLLGDIPDLVSYLSKGGGFVEWLTHQHGKSDSAIKQLFLRPFGKPIVVLADYRESREIMVYRTKEFDRGKDVGMIFGPVVGTNQVTQPTGPDWKLHRRLVQDTMSPAFLRNVVAPSIHASCRRFIELWNTKMGLANGRPFSAADDLFYATFDAVNAFTFGSAFPHSAINPQRGRIEKLCADKYVSGETETPVEFPCFDIDERISCMIKLVDGIEKAQSSPYPPLTWLMTKATPWFRRARELKNECIRDEITKAIANMKQNEGSNDQAWIQNATNEETLRYRPTAPLGTRDAIRDTAILGYPIPKGTTVMWTLTASSFVQPAVRVDESRRTPRSQEEKRQGRVVEWNEANIALFKPERWLAKDDKGNDVFNANAGPNSPFGMGLRSCFGQRLAYIEMKTLLTMLVWNFELLQCPNSLSGHAGRLAVTYKPIQCYVRLNKVDYAAA